MSTFDNNPRPTRQPLWLLFLALMGILTLGCGVEDILGPEEYISSRKQPTVPLKRVAKWENVRCFDTFPSFKRTMAKPGDSEKSSRKQWHHIVAQHAENKKNFSEHDLHCTDNVVHIEYEDHKKLNSYYASKQDKLGNKSFRDWLRPMTFDEQYAHGVKAMDKLKVKYEFIR